MAVSSRVTGPYDATIEVRSSVRYRTNQRRVIALRLIVAEMRQRRLVIVAALLCIEQGN
jgi:hypothetical protein